MILLQCEYLSSEDGAIEEHRSEYLIPKGQISSISQIDFQPYGLNPCLKVECVDGSILYCRGVLDSIIGQLESNDHTAQIEDLMAALDGIGEVLGKALYKFQEYRSEDLTRPVC
jgi:hypothetical protein